MTRTMLAALCGLVLVVPCPGARDKTDESWRTRDNLVNRLEAEWYKINLLSRDLEALDDVLKSSRDLEVFPPAVTRLSDDAVVVLDRKTERIEKRQQELMRQVADLRPALGDALAILREMVIGAPVEDMFLVLEKGDLDRIDQMLRLRHAIADLWLQTDTLLGDYARQMQIAIPPRRRASGSEEEFQEIIKANLGRQSEQYYEKLNALKDTLARRGTPEDNGKMLAAELARVRKVIDEGKTALAEDKLNSLSVRYAAPQLLPRILVVLARVRVIRRDWERALQAVLQLPRTADLAGVRRLYLMQCLYALGRYKELWTASEGVVFDKLPERERNQAIWLTMESALALGRDGECARLASYMSKTGPNALHVLYALAKSYMRVSNWKSALSVLESAQRFRPAGNEDRAMLNRIRLAVAQTNYQMGDYQKSLALFMELVNQDQGFEEALYGVVWSYTSLGQYSKAEASLRKLINQSPESPLAAEAILLMAKQYVRAAQTDWATLTAVTRSSERLRSMMEKLEQRARADKSLRSTPAYRKAMEEINATAARLGAEKLSDYAGIAASYDKAQDICGMVARFYGTGSFQERSFSSKRERLLHNLDSILIEVRGAGRDAAARREAHTQALANVARIKELVSRSGILRVEFDLDRYRWERDYIDWAKSRVRDRLEQARAAMDTARDTLVRRSLSARMASMDRTIDSLVARGDEVRRQWHERLVAACSTLLQDAQLSPEDVVYYRYQLGELHYTDENERYLREYQTYDMAKAAYDSLMALFRKGAVVDMPNEPMPPTLDHSQSMDNFFTALSQVKRGDDMEAAIRYSLAWCYSDLNAPEAAVAQMETLATNYPQHAYAPQAWMYIGEYEFDRGDLKRAADAYRSAMAYPDSRWFDEALYKYAWTQYRLSNPEKAISSFLALVDLGGGKVDAKRILEKESMDYVAISFSESDLTGERGLERAVRFLARLNDEAKGTQILHRLAQVYRDQGRYDMARKTYQTLLRTYPANAGNPLVERELIGTMERDTPDSVLNRTKMAFYEKYNHDSEWARKQTDARSRGLGDSLAAQMLYDVGLSLHQNALQKSDTALYNVAARTYERFIRAYPRSKKANECHYNFAEILFSLGNYQRAAEEYMAVSQRYPDSKYRETAAWNAIVASQNLMKREKAVTR